MTQRMQQRRDTAANWTSVNPILANGEIGLETDTTPRKFKIGNGVSTWTALSYATQPYSANLERLDGTAAQQRVALGVEHPWAGKKVACLGTSITAQGSYTSALTSRGMIVTNLGVSGGTISNSASSQPAAIHAQIANIPLDTDLVTIEAAINDFRTNATLGTIADTTLATYYGALYVVLRDVFLRVPTATVVFLLPFGNTDTNYAGTWRTNNDNGNSLAQFRAAIRQVCEQTSVPMIDLADSLVGPRTVTAYMPDGIHPNSAGGEKIASLIWESLRTLQPNTITPTTGWNLRTIEAGDISYTNMGAGTLTGDDFTSGSVTSGSFGANWFASGTNNAAEFETSTGWIVVGEGASGFCGFGDATTDSIVFFSTVAAGAITHFNWDSPSKSPATRFRVARIGDLLYLQQYVSSAWEWVVNGVDIDTLNPNLSGYKATVKIGTLSNAATVNNIRVGTYTP